MYNFFVRNVSPVIDSIFNLNNLEIHLEKLFRPTNFWIFLNFINLTLVDEAARVGTTVAAGRGVMFDHLLLLL
jgi:hypothetical protein